MGAKQAIQVLLVDDNELNREMEADMLEPYDFQVVQAESGKQAVALVRETAFDLIFLDYLMPEMDGLETAEQINRLCASLDRKPVMIALTADESQETFDAFQARGCQGLLTKPMDEEKLDRVLAQWLDLDLGEKAAEAVQPRGMIAEEAASIQIPGIDLEGSQIGQRKTKDQYLDLLSLYWEDGTQQQKIWRSVSREQMQDYRIWVHALKSASANIGALDLSEQARAQEMAAKEGDYPQIQEGFPKLMEAYRVLLEGIADCLRENGVTSEAEQITQPALNESELKARLGDALEMLEDFRHDECVQIIQELLRHSLPEEVRTQLHEAHGMLRMYQDDDAEELLRGAIGKIDRDE